MDDDDDDDMTTFGYHLNMCRFSEKSLENAQSVAELIKGNSYWMLHLLLSDIDNTYFMS